VTALVDPRWLVEAKVHVGLAEVPGKDNNPTLQRWLRELGAWWSDDGTAWCGTFVAHCLRHCALPVPPAWYRARAWADYGIALATPLYGCIVVFSRTGGGHVGFVVGVDPAGRLRVLGGNQGDRVSYAWFDPARVIAYRRPVIAVPEDLLRQPPPLLQADGTPASVNEA